MYLTYILYTHFVNGLLQQSSFCLIQSLIRVGTYQLLLLQSERLLISSHPVSTVRSNLSCCCTKVHPKILTTPIRQIGGHIDIQNHLSFSFMLLFLLLRFAVHSLDAPRSRKLRFLASSLRVTLVFIGWFWVCLTSLTPANPMKLMEDLKCRLSPGVRALCE